MYLPVLINLPISINLLKLDLGFEIQSYAHNLLTFGQHLYKSQNIEVLFCPLNKQILKENLKYFMDEIFTA